MSTQTVLKLVHPLEDSDVIQLERRNVPRHTLNGRVTALQTRERDQESRNRICSMQLLNISETGMGALVQEAVDTQTRVVVFFPPHGPERGFDLHGRVVRCTAREHGHEVGIQFDVRRAA